MSQHTSTLPVAEDFSALQGQPALNLMPPAQAAASSPPAAQTYELVYEQVCLVHLLSVCSEFAL